MRWLYAAAWLVLLAIYCVAFIANGVPVALSIRNAVANLLPSALLGLAVLRLPEFLPWTQHRKGRFFGAHAGLLVAFVTLSTVGWIGLMTLDAVLFDGRFTINYRIIPFRVLNDVLIYGAFAGVAYVREQAERAAQAESLRARASLEAMRSQLNPHFILNTFHALVGLVRRDPEVAESALERLGDLLRYSLRIQRDGIDEVPLREECAFVESYLALERLRLGDRLAVRIDPLPANEALVPTFALQTLVENAIHHAIAPRAAGGMLQISMQQNDGRLRVTVQDEGTGAPVEARFNGSGLGLRLLQQRLAALYGNDATLTLRGIEGGTRAELDLPMRRVENES
jgi:sensor histidine kinase YesM